MTTIKKNSADNLTYEEMQDICIGQKETVEFVFGELNGTEVTMTFDYDKDYDWEGAICNGADYGDAVAADCEDGDWGQGEIEKWISIYRQLVDDVSFRTVIRTVLDGTEYEEVSVFSDAYFYFDETIFLEKIKKAIAASSLDLKGLYERVKTPDLEVSIEAMTVCPKVMGDVPLFYEGYYHQGDATDEQVTTLAIQHELSDGEDIFDHLDNLHESLIEESIMEHYGDRQAAIMGLIAHGVHEGKF